LRLRPTCGNSRSEDLPHSPPSNTSPDPAPLSSHRGPCPVGYLC
jgi:hypothetical protein